MWTELERRDERLGYALVRATLGMSLLMHGGDTDVAWARFKLQVQFAQTPLPAWSVRGFGVLLPGVEAIVGTLLLVGLRTRVALVATGLLMVALTFGACLIEDWTAAGLQLGYAALIAVLLGLLRFNGWSVDWWLKRKNDEHSMML